MAENQQELFELSETEWRERSKRLAVLVQEYKDTEANKKLMVKTMNESLKELRENIEKLAEAVSQGKEWRTLLNEPPEWDR